MELAAQRKIVVWAHIALDFPAKEALLSTSTASSWSPPRPAPSAGLVVV